MDSRLDVKKIGKKSNSNIKAPGLKEIGHALAQPEDLRPREKDGINAIFYKKPRN